MQGLEVRSYTMKVITHCEYCDGDQSWALKVKALLVPQVATSKLLDATSFRLLEPDVHDMIGYVRVSLYPAAQERLILPQWIGLVITS